LKKEKAVNLQCNVCIDGGTGVEGGRWKIENLVVCAINGQKWLQPGPDHMINLSNLEYSLFFFLGS